MEIFSSSVFTPIKKKIELVITPLKKGNYHQSPIIKMNFVFEEKLICSYCKRDEEECEKNTENEKNPITEWCGWGVSCDDCYYKNNAEDEEDDCEENEEKCEKCGGEKEDKDDKICHACYHPIAEWWCEDCNKDCNKDQDEEDEEDDCEECGDCKDKGYIYCPTCSK